MTAPFAYGVDGRRGDFCGQANRLSENNVPGLVWAAGGVRRDCAHKLLKFMNLRPFDGQLGVLTKVR